MGLKEQREQAEMLIYKVFDTVDTTKTNSDYYRKLFAFKKQTLGFRI